MASNSSTALVEIYRPFLANVPEDPSQFNPYLGGQSFGTCCLLAVSESLFIDNDTLRIRPGQSFFRGDMATLERFPSFPCAATFNGTMEGPPEDFWTPYSWCRRRCPGWQATSPETFGYWLKPLGAFILPSLIFCLSIPRRRRLEMPTAFAPSYHSGRALGVFLYAVNMLAAFVASSIDILIWLSVVFAIAGPILVSAIYEALLDARILRFLQRRLRSNSLSIRNRGHLLLVILLGNLDFEPAWHHSKLLVQGLPNEAFLSPLASTPTPRSIPWNAVSDSSDVVCVKSQVHAMLDAQPSFGDTVGAPVLFYIAGFIWSVYEIQTSYGTYQSAHQISFGLLWMTIPHIALITSLLLAGNNPSVFQGAVSRDGAYSQPARENVCSARPGTPPTSAPTMRFPAQIRRYFSYLSQNPQDSRVAFGTSPYRVAWVWNRGSNKARWIAKLADEYRPDLEALHHEVLGRRFDAISWSAGFWAFILIFIPVFFGGVVSYHTPSVGFGCWSLTMLFYGSIQLLLIMLWLVSMLVWNRGADGRVIHDATVTNKTGTWSGHIWYAGFAFSVCVSVFHSVGGTIFILIGLYSNCLCFTPARYWYNIMTNPDATIFWNSATDSQLYYSQEWWFPAGVAGTVFIAAIAYLGWWYQKHLRSRFHHLVERMSDVDEKHLRESTGMEVNRQSARL